MKVTALVVAMLMGGIAAVQAADAPPKARVATGAEVTLLPSSRTAAQWTALRPHVRALRPRARGTLD